MTVYTLAWGKSSSDPSGQHTIHVASPDDAAAALDRIAASARERNCPCLVDVYEGVWREGDPTPPYGFQMVWGHRERAALFWLGEEGGYAVSPTVGPEPLPIGYDYDEAEPRHTRLTVADAVEAVREYVRTGQRFAGVQWVED